MRQLTFICFGRRLGSSKWTPDEEGIPIFPCHFLLYHNISRLAAHDGTFRFFLHAIIVIIVMINHPGHTQSLSRFTLVVNPSQALIGP